MRRAPAVPVYYAVEVLGSMPSYVFTAVYLVREVHLSPLQLVLVGTAMEISVFVFEIPTGVVADTFGRRASLVVSLVLQGLAWGAVGLTTSFPVILAAWAVWGFGYTFQSGAYEAWITDEVGADRVGGVFLRGARLSYLGALLGLAGSVALATVSLRLPIVVAGAVLVALGLGSAVLMPETGFVPRPRAEQGSAVGELRGTALAGGRVMRATPVLLLIVGIEFVTGSSDEAFDRLWEAHLIRDVGLPVLGSLDPVVWFGLLGGAVLVVGLAASTWLIHAFDGASSLRLARALLGLTTALMVAELVFAVAGSLALAAVAFVVSRLARSLARPLMSTWLNGQIEDSSVRATVLSMTGQANAVGEAGGGVLLGGVGNLLGIRAALAGGAFVLAPALALYGRALRHHGREPELGSIDLSRGAV